ncbi:MAG: Maf family protein [Candidatus Fimenecus sp.]
MKLILASNSPRRAEILKQGGFSFEKRVSDADETLPADIAPDTAVEILAQRKGCAVFRAADEVILAADTVVALRNRILGKPKDEEEAKEMLRALSGHTHSVFTGVYITDGEREFLFHTQTRVTFYPLSETEIDMYVQSGEPLDKAGAYGIQGRGALFVEKIDGDYLNAVGLPLSKTARILKEVL